MLLIALPMLVSIVTGNASAESIVNTQVNGDKANVQTTITTQVNGKVTTVQSDTSGTIEVKATDAGTQVHTNSQVQPTITVQQRPANQKNLSVSILSFFETLLAKLFQKLRIGA